MRMIDLNINNCHELLGVAKIFCLDSTVCFPSHVHNIHVPDLVIFIMALSRSKEIIHLQRRC